MNDVMPGSDVLGFLVILNKSSELRFEAGRSELIFGPGWGQSSYGLGGARARLFGQHRKIVSLSPCVKNLNLKKVIKVSYLNQESRQCFVFFGFLCVWTLYEHMYISRIRIMAMLQSLLKFPGLFSVFWPFSIYYYYYSLIRAFHISVSRWFFTGVWVTASLLKSPGLLLVFWPFSIMLSFGWSPLVRQLPSPPVPLIIL